MLNNNNINRTSRKDTIHLGIEYMPEEINSKLRLTNNDDTNDIFSSSNILLETR